MALIVVNFAVFGWRTYAGNHVPLKQITTVTADEIIGTPSNISGETSANFVLVEFGDYECPPCAQLFRTIQSFTPARLSARYI